MTRVGAGVSLLLFTACGSSSSAPPATTAPSCPQSGTVPADLRDVERSGEGLVTTTFGDTAGGHSPDWARAAQVLAVLKTVWGRSKSQCPNLPPQPASRIDAAITTLDTAVPSADQKSAVFAANAIGLAVPDIFDWFHPDSPKEVVRMDAFFRQAGIDAFFGDWAAAQGDAASLSTDWASVRSTVEARVPTCHRVGGTATVATDIDASLATMSMAVATSDLATFEKETEKAAAEVDTLELLFDCPPDGATADQGLGAACTQDSQCEAGQVCDTSNRGGVCAPSPSTAKIGTACTTTVDCGTDSRSACLTEAGDGYPGGYCGMEPCDDVHVCPPGATCVSLGGETPSCLLACTDDSACRVAEGYVCQLFLTVSPVGFGPSNRACAFPCTDDAQCQNLSPADCPAGQPCPKLTCDTASGKCTP